MGQYARVLTACAVNKLSKPGLNYVGGVPNLALAISKKGARSWVLRYSICDKRHDMGLGPYPEVSLSEARKIALDKRHLLRQGIDPIAQRRETLSKLRSPKNDGILFKQAAVQLIASKRDGWKNKKHASQWDDSLRLYVYPIIGHKRVDEISVQHILQVLQPIWSTKTETAKRLRGRMECILDWCKIRGYREGDNPAAWSGNLEMILPPPNKIAKVKHLAALEWKKCPAFFAGLNMREGISIEALKFCILTASRSNEVRGASWTEIDFDNAIWMIPPERMKAGREHRVPLSPYVIELLKRLPRLKGESLLFPNAYGNPLSDMTLLQIIRRTGGDFTVHGFRSSFRDWASEATNHPREIAEYALAHRVKDKTEAAYARSDLLEKRRLLMNDWADFLHCPN